MSLTNLSLLLHLPRSKYHVHFPKTPVRNLCLLILLSRMYIYDGCQFGNNQGYSFIPAILRAEIKALDFNQKCFLILSFLAQFQLILLV